MVRARGSSLVLLLGCAAFLGPTPARAATFVESPAEAAIDATCNAYRPAARPADVIRIARLAGNDGSLGPWQLASDDAIDRARGAPGFTVGEFATFVLDRGAIVSADLAHDDAASATVLAHAWCFIGGKLSRATADISTTSPAGVTGYRRTRYYGDDLGVPLAEIMQDKGFQSGSYRAPPKEVDVLLVTDPVARPIDLPFYDAFAAARARTLPRLR